MFSHSELDLIKELCESAKENQQTIPQMCDLASEEGRQQKADAESRIARLQAICEVCDYAKKTYGYMDPSMLIDFRATVSEYDDMITDLHREGALGAEDYGFEKYTIGYLGAKTEVLGYLTGEEIDLIDEQFTQAIKERHPI